MDGFTMESFCAGVISGILLAGGVLAHLMITLRRKVNESDTPMVVTDTGREL